MAFTDRVRLLIAGAVTIGAVGFGSAQAQQKFDLSPEQPNRLRVEKNEKRIAEVKDFKFVENGVFTVGISSSGNLPLHDYASDSKTVIGYDVDLAQAVADSLGLKLNLVSVAWADWPLGLTSGKFDAVISNVTVTEERKQKFDFSTYRKDELGFYVKADSPITALKQPKDIAGLKVITDAGTNQEKILLEWDRQNVAAGLKPTRCNIMTTTRSRISPSSPAEPTPSSVSTRRRPMRRASMVRPSSSAPSAAVGRSPPRLRSPPAKTAAWPLP
ncbi:ABC-type amino acid transport substrate-binding protein [Rhizobium sp. BK619]|nr:ABC-type amino acid transport substrate-binding protein [Rhizobium sp. BK619]